MCPAESRLSVVCGLCAVHLLNGHADIPLSMLSGASHAMATNRTEWEGFRSATRAAAAGGTTTVLDMPLNNVPSTISVQSLAMKLKALAQADAVIDVGFIAGIVPSNLGSLASLYRAGVIAFKSFMVDSQSADFPHVSPENMTQAMQVLASLASENPPTERPPPYILHAELTPPTYDPARPYDGNHQSYRAYLESRPEEWEVDAVEAALDAAANTGCRVHIAHVSSARAAELLVQRRSADSTLRDAVSAETCPQYLLWAAEEIPDGEPTFKCAPPIRPEANRQRLWAVVRENSGIQIVASDHSPAEPALKKLEEGDIRAAWGGISGLQYRLPATWTAMQELEKTPSVVFLSRLLSTSPAVLFGLDTRKGRIASGLDADFVVWNPEARAMISERDCKHRHSKSPFIGMKLSGVVHWSILRGRAAFARDPSTAASKSEGLALTRRVLGVDKIADDGAEDSQSHIGALSADDMLLSIQKEHPTDPAYNDAETTGFDEL